MINREINIIGVPVDLGTQRLGVDMGPNALRYAGLIHVVKQAGLSVKDLGNIHVPTPESRLVGQQNLKYLDDIVTVSETLSEMVFNVVKSDAFPLILGGDHSLAIGSVSGFAHALDDQPFGLIWIDAHPDCNTQDTTLSGNIHGMSLAVLLGSGHPSLVNCSQLGAKLNSKRLSLVGIKDMDPAEFTFIQNNKLNAFTMDDISGHGVSQMLDELYNRFEGMPVYISLDLDVVDSMYAPGVGIRSHGGFTYREIRFLCKYLGRNMNIAGLEVVEFNPLCDHENKTAELALELIMAILGQDYGDYQRYLNIQKF